MNRHTSLVHVDTVESIRRRQQIAGINLRCLKAKARGNPKAKVSDVSGVRIVFLTMTFELSRTNVTGIWTNESERNHRSQIRGRRPRECSRWRAAPKQGQQVRWDDNWHEKHEHDRDHELMIESGYLGHVCPLRFAPQFQVTSPQQKQQTTRGLATRWTTNCGSSSACGPTLRGQQFRYATCVKWHSSTSFLVGNLGPPVFLILPSSPLFPILSSSSSSSSPLLTSGTSSPLSLHRSRPELLLLFVVQLQVFRCLPARQCFSSPHLVLTAFCAPWFPTRGTTLASGTCFGLFEPSSESRPHP